MCGGVRMMQGRRPTLIHISALLQHEPAKPHYEIDSNPNYCAVETVISANSLISKDTEELNYAINNQAQSQSAAAASAASSQEDGIADVEQQQPINGGRVLGSRDAVGLGIVAAMSMELIHNTNNNNNNNQPMPPATSRPSAPAKPRHAHSDDHERESIFFTAEDHHDSIFFTAYDDTAGGFYDTRWFSGDEPPEYLSAADSSPVFLRACFLCKSPLRQGRDIYMYRGDRAFCSIECRYQQIDLDEQKERCPTMTVCKGDQASEINKVNYHTVQIVG